MTPEFWPQKRIFLTGHTGFKGSWLALWLQALGAEVTGYALEPPGHPSLFERARVDGALDSILADLRDLETLDRAMERAKPEIVLHLAAQSLVRRGYDEPLETYSTNVLGTAHVLEAARRQPSVRVVVSVTTDKCYRDNHGVRGYVEDDPLGGKDPYSSSKAGAELVTAAYRASYFTESRGRTVGVATARAGNVIGGGDWAVDRLVPDLIRGFEAGEAAPIRSPHAVRPWQHVLEPLRGYLDLAEALWRDPAAYSEGWNFGPEPDDARPVSWIADRMTERWGDGAAWETDARAHPPEANYLRLDCAKAASRLGWTPRLPLEDALEWIVDWHRRETAGEDPRELTLEQIRSYETRV